MRNAIWILALVGCHYSPSNPAGDDVPPGVDAPRDEPGIPDVPLDAQACFGTAPFEVCIPMQPTGDLDLSTLNSADRDTSDPGNTKCLEAVPSGWMTAQGDACVIVARNIAVPTGQTAAFTGDRPLVLVATQMLKIEGTLDVASKVAGQKGPGGSPTSALCVTTNGGLTAGGKGGGGAGGSFGGPGAAGGFANNMAATAGVAGLGEGEPHVLLHGGCKAGDGALGGGASVAAAGGNGGGAVFLVGTSVAISGTVNASGAGGKLGTSSKGGAGGGGAGGMIVVDGGTIMITGTLVANGGGGGGGAEATNSGGDGFDPVAATATTQANGGPKATGGAAGDGGKGAAGQNGPVAGGNINDGGGGAGGGGIGVIRVLHGTVPTGNKISPDATN